ncbi:Fe-S cluster formation NifU-like protein [uncultured Desulfobacterium sp.]|uniref:Fe-S cluster formation NifU-like protein n=1 Tax=uncultured Desulfobacterium sp. TaxID=201089 RepID=A0A445N0N6_9BACT|nr:Fe-S cluster formation NifU-like protein [uncultured Desulfobacterium sp.]
MKDDLYADPIITWAKDKTHERPLSNADISVRLSNPLCGDMVTIEIKCKGNSIVKIAHQVRGCLLCKASAAHLASLAAGLDAHGLKEIYDALKEALKSSDDDHPFPPDYTMFAPVRAHKSRHSCVLLPYEAAIKALAAQGVENDPT